MPTTAPHPTPPTLGDPGDHHDDVAAITALIADVAKGVSSQDPDRCVARFAADSRSVTTQRLVDRDAVRDAHVAAFARAGTPARARFEILDVLFVRPDLAIATTGAHPVGPDDPIDRDAPPTVVVWTLVRQDGGWRVAARQLTRMTP